LCALVLSLSLFFLFFFFLQLTSDVTTLPVYHNNRIKRHALTFPNITAFGIRVDTKDISDTFAAALNESTSPAKTLWTFST
jgi:hypothetical protein